MAMAFQLDDQTLRQIYDYYNISKDKAFLILPVAGIIRFSFALRGGVDEQVAVFKDILICCVLLAVFTSFIALGMELPQIISKLLNFGDVTVNVDPEPGNKFSIMVSWACRAITYLCYVVARGIYYISLLVMCVLAAWVILAMTMTSFTSGFLMYMVLFLLVCLIPTFWTLINIGTKILFDAKDADWNNGILILSSAAKAWFSCVTFKKALYDPFLKSFISTMGSIASKGAALSQGGLGLAAGTMTALGGKKYVDGTKDAVSNLKSSALKHTGMAIPTAEKLISSLGAKAMKGINDKAPNAGAAIKRGADFFKNQKNPYNLKDLPGTSPAMQTLKNSSGSGVRFASLKAAPKPSTTNNVASETTGNAAPSFTPKITPATPKESSMPNLSKKTSYGTNRNPLPHKSTNMGSQINQVRDTPPRNVSPLPSRQPKPPQNRSKK